MNPTLKILTASDLHRSVTLLAALRDAVIQLQPNLVALVGDFLHGFDDDNGRVTAARCAHIISTLPVEEVVLVRGNHEDDAWRDFVEAWNTSGRPLHALHGEVFTHGPMTIVGFPCLMGDEIAFIGERPPLPIESDEWLPEVILPAGRAARTLWLMHEPPAGTPLSAAGSVVEGNPDWVTAIERFSPWLTISGHDHITPIRSGHWHHRIGRSTCVNVGQTDKGPLHFCLVEAEFDGGAPNLPIRMQVTAYPWGETVALPAGDVISTKANKGKQKPAGFPTAKGKRKKL